MKKNLDTMKPRYSEQIFSVSWPFGKSRFHRTIGIVTNIELKM